MRRKTVDLGSASDARRLREVHGRWPEPRMPRHVPILQHRFPFARECTGGGKVTLCTIDGMGHCWPGTGFCPFGAFNTEISASAMMVELFQKYRLP